ncbi:penicillin-binding protein activator [Aliikangiella sp. IMCC44653]
MMNYITQSNKLIISVLIALMLQGCGPVVKENKRHTNNASQNLEYILNQAKQALPHQKSQLLVQAAGLLVKEARYEKAQEILVRVDQTRLTPLEVDDFNLYYGETLLALGAHEKALNHIQSVHLISAKPIHWQIRHAQSLSDAFLANSNYFEAAKQRIQLDDLIDDEQALRQNNEKIWAALNQIQTDFLLQLKSDFNSQRLNGWLEIAYINQRWGYHPKKLLAEIERWQLKYPLHPSSVNQPEVLRKAAAAEEFTPKKIAILLPLSGKLGSFGKMIHDGILAAHYQTPEATSAPQLAFYDTAKNLSSLTAYQQAQREGADFILGPLTKEAIESILQQEEIQIPMLALNRTESETFTHPQVYQFGLPIEDEAIQAAHYAIKKGYTKAIAFLPQNSTGARAENAFRATFEELGGELISVENYREINQLKQNVQKLLRVDTSIQRKRSLERLLGRNLEFEMRRRQDADFIFMLARPEDGRRIKPFINYYFAHDLPVIATSSIFSGKRDPQTDIDLNGIEFTDIPLLLSEQAEFEQTRQTLGQILPEALDARGRYFALGYDSYNILSQLAILQAFPEYRWNGLTGELGVDFNGLVHRYLTWAQFNRGVPNVTDERKVKALEASANPVVPNTIQRGGR